MSEANAPNTPPLLAERDLNDAEKKVLKAFREGWKAGERQIIVHPGISSISNAEEIVKMLKLDATLRAHFLRSLFLGSYDRFSPRSVMISCAWIEGRLDLNYCEPCFPLAFSECIFSKGISLRAAIISELGLVKCLIGQDQKGSSIFATQVQVTTNVSLDNQFIAHGEVDLNSASIGGQLICAGGYFKKGLTAQSLKTGGNVFLRSGFESDGVVDLSGADIRGQFVCDGGKFKKGLLAESLKTSNDVILAKGFKSNGLVDLMYADIGGNLNCDGGYFKKGLGAQSLKAGKGVSLMEGFKSNGEVNLSGANIGRQFTCAGGIFKEGLKAQNLNTGDSVFLTKKFTSKEVVDMIGAKIGGQFACVGGHFGKGLRIQNIKTGGSVFLAEGFESGGEVNLSSAVIDGQLDCAGGRFEKALKAQGLKTSNGVFLRGKFEPNDVVDLLGADIGGQLDCTGAHFEKGLIADGLRYQRINLGGDWEKGLAWLSKMPESENRFFPQPYEQLMTVYRRMGYPDWARKIGFELEKKRHKNLPKTGRFWIWRAWYSILQGTIGYGYKPFQSLWLAIGLPLVGAILFSDGTQSVSSKFTSSGCVPAFLTNEWIPSEGEAHEHWRQKGQAPQGYPEFQPFIYSLEATFPVLPLGQLDKWHPENTLFRVVRWVWTFTGSGLLAILALFGVGTLGPNRKSEGDGS